MRLFDTAYLKLTGWYVLIIMAISLTFSVWVYNQARHELQIGLNRFVHVGPIENLPNGEFGQFVQERLDDSRQRLVLRLTSLNLIVLAVSAALALHRALPRHGLGRSWLARGLL